MVILINNDHTPPYSSPIFHRGSTSRFSEGGWGQNLKPCAGREVAPHRALRAHIPHKWGKKKTGKNLSTLFKTRLEYAYDKN